ncbi:hypothetical protein [Virgibacillus sp. YIM 98842]|jgi:hypothetical protein|uniref:hypothetical protein n=1 Tax=Virgibacillus sp. YIM 98842 TaxID=2663533 RepID=UPI0013DD55A2|nr:hypothetical protein [Virgibacillus sp. YIM 98842]
MGYILPIEHHIYMDYHNRVIKQKTTPYIIERPFRVILEEEHQRLSSEYERINNTYQKTSPPNPHKQEEPDMRWMGKGKHVSEKI